MSQPSSQENTDPPESGGGGIAAEFDYDEECVLAALAWFTFPVSVSFVARLTAFTRLKAHGNLEDLAQRSLVVRGEEKHTFAAIPAVTASLRRQDQWYIKEIGQRLEKRACALIIRNGYDNHERFPVLEAAWPTIAPALPLILAGDNDRLQDVCAALTDFLDFTGRWDEWLSLCREAETRALAAGDYDNAGWRAYHAGWLYYLRSEAPAVLECAARVAAHWTVAKAGAREQSIAIRLRGIGHHLQQDYLVAIAAYKEVLALHRRLSPLSADVAISLNDLASAEHLSGDYDAAERDYQEALRVARAAGYGEGEAFITGNLADLALERKDWPAAEALAREALPLSEKLRREEMIAHDNRRLAHALMRQDRASEGLPHARRAVEIYVKLGISDLVKPRTTLAEYKAGSSGI